MSRQVRRIIIRGTERVEDVMHESGLPRATVVQLMLPCVALRRTIILEVPEPAPITVRIVGPIEVNRPKVKR